MEKLFLFFAMAALMALSCVPLIVIVSVKSLGA